MVIKDLSQQNPRYICWRKKQCSQLLRSNDREEHVEGNLNRVDENKTVLGADELEINGVNDWPNLPRTLDRLKQIVLNLVGYSPVRITIYQSHIAEKDRHKDRTPKKLINSNLQGHKTSLCSWN